MGYNLDYILGACGIAVGVNGIATSLYTKINFPEGAMVSEGANQYISDYGLHQWMNGFIYGLSMTLLVGSFALGLGNRAASRAAA